MVQFNVGLIMLLDRCMHIPPSEILKKALAVDEGHGVITMPTMVFSLLLRAAFAEAFDARWYRAAYPDVAAAVDKGEVASELDHFIEGGYWEGRMPCSFAVNEEWYKRQYEDVRTAIEAGEIASAHLHYNKTGYFEGRAPDAAAELIAAKWSHTLMKVPSVGVVDAG